MNKLLHWFRKDGKTDSRVMAYIGLGGNLGDTHANIHKALQMLSTSHGNYVTQVSRIVKTKPLGGRQQPDYLNAVAELKTSLPPQQLMTRLRQIEDALGRVRTEKWQSRSIDLDLLLYGDQVVNTENLTVPHPQMHFRSFVMEGMCELAPKIIHPVLNRTMEELADRLQGQDFVPPAGKPQLVSIAGPIGVGKTTLARGLAAEWNAPVIEEAFDQNPYLPDVYAGRHDLALQSQLFFLESRGRQIAQDHLQPQKIYVSDYVFDKELIFARRTLDIDQFADYQKEYRRVAAGVCIPVVVVHLQDTAQNCVERIRQRCREFEQGVEIPDVDKFVDDYTFLFSRWKSTPVVRLRVGQFDSRSSSHIRKLARELEHYLCRS